MRKIFLLVGVIFLSLILIGCESDKYTITWVNYDGEVLEIDKNVKEGSSTEYNGAIPFRASDDTYSYRFEHFRDSNNKRLETNRKVSKNETFTAYFSRQEINPLEKITYSWVNIGIYGVTTKLVVVLSNGSETTFIGNFRLRLGSNGTMHIYDWNLTNFDLISSSQGTWTLKIGATPRATYLSTQYTTYYTRGLLE